MYLRHYNHEHTQVFLLSAPRQKLSSVKKLKYSCIYFFPPQETKNSVLNLCLAAKNNYKIISILTSAYQFQSKVTHIVNLSLRMKCIHFNILKLKFLQEIDWTVQTSQKTPVQCNWCHLTEKEKSLLCQCRKTHPLCNDISLSISLAALQG